MLIIYVVNKVLIERWRILKITRSNNFVSSIVYIFMLLGKSNLILKETKKIRNIELLYNWLWLRIYKKRNIKIKINIK